MMYQPKRPNYDDIVLIPTPREEQEEKIQADIDKITNALERGDEDECWRLHREIDGKYQARIPDWGLSMWGYTPGMGFVCEGLGYESVAENLQMMKSKLEGELLGLKPVAASGNPNVQNNINVRQEQSNVIRIQITFEDARKAVEDMDALSRDETDEIKKRIDELEELQKSKLSKKDKWAKVKEILAFMLDKGVDVAIMMMSLALQTMM